MTTFSFWDILRNLLLAARWTVVLSLVCFVGGGVVGVDPHAADGVHHHRHRKPPRHRAYARRRRNAGRSARPRASVYSDAVVALGGELAVPCTRDPLQRG